MEDVLLSDGEVDTTGWNEMGRAERHLKSDRLHLLLKLAGKLGFEPRYRASKALVLPLDDFPIGGQGGI